ncbi:unnamed protein product [Vicia faba]|uniref:Uncharacterized protein n=1 Tax=Vicia faba TaxID=3906 RepID=A0AAV0ZG78_VICFA|nr:unnamed protein product [Vicia faba]
MQTNELVVESLPKVNSDELAEVVVVTETVPPNRIDVVERFLIASSAVLPSGRLNALLRMLSENWDVSCWRMKHGELRGRSIEGGLLLSVEETEEVRFLAE